jgi:hypothetical protein
MAEERHIECLLINFGIELLMKMKTSWAQEESIVAKKVTIMVKEVSIMAKEENIMVQKVKKEDATAKCTMENTINMMMTIRVNLDSAQF